MLRWLTALIASSFTFALADVLCDICITESEADSRKVETADDDDDVSEPGIEMSSLNRGGRYEQEQTPQPARYRALGEPKAVPFEGDDVDGHEEDHGLSGAQDAAIAGLITIVALVFSIIHWFLLSAPATDALATARKGSFTLRWRPSTHLQWWLAMLGGASVFLHYFFLLKAFEGAPSTVLLPLVQARADASATAVDPALPTTPASCDGMNVPAAA